MYIPIKKKMVNTFVSHFEISVCVRLANQGPYTPKKNKRKS